MKKQAAKITELSPAQAPRDHLSFLDAAGEPRGYCYCCSRIGFKLDRAGKLSRHGFTRPRWAGYTTGACSGTRYTPEETLAIAIDSARAQLARLDALLATDLVRFAIDALLRAERANAARLKWTYKRGTYTRRDTARRLRAVRTHDLEKMVEYPGATRPANWSTAGRRVELTEDRAACARWLAELLKVRELATR